MVSVDQVYMIGHMKNADGSINNKNVVLSAACEAAELFQCMMAVNQKLEDWQRFNHTLEMLYYQVFVGMLEININSAEVLYKQKEKTINE